MYINEKYPSDFTRIKELINIKDDRANSPFFYGCISRVTDSRGKKTFFNIPYYAIVYVVEGTAIYIDAESGREYDVYPGCIIQRMPDTPHYSILPGNSQWREFYVQGSADLYSTLLNMNVITSEPVFYLGEGEDIHEKFIEYDEKYKNTDIHRTADIIPGFTELLLYIHSYKTKAVKSNWADTAAKILARNINVNISLREIADMCNTDYENMRKQFKKIFGCSMSEYRMQLRINEAKNLLVNSKMSVKQVAYRLGYCDAYAFGRQFKQYVGLSPGKYVQSRKQI